MQFLLIWAPEWLCSLLPSPKAKSKSAAPHARSSPAMPELQVICQQLTLLIKDLHIPCEMSTYA